MRTVFEFNEPRDYLAHLFKEKQEKNPSYSLRSWAKALGFKGPASLSMILRGQRRLQVQTASRLSELLELPSEEQSYLQLLTLYSAARTQHEKGVYSNLMTQLRPQARIHALGLDQFRLIADWYHFAIYEMTDLRGFEPSGEWIAKRLGGAITSLTAHEALERLVRLALLVREPSTGKVTKCTSEPVRTTDDVPSTALRKFHSQMISKALKALEAQSVQEREISSQTVCVERSQVPEIKDRIRRFQQEIVALCDSRQGDEVYQLNSQFFRLTEN